MDELSCPRCDTDEHLTGDRADEVIHITCTACGLKWDRDTSPRCATCGASDDLHTISEPVIEKARGTQLSIVGVTTTHLCPACYKRNCLARDCRHIPRARTPPSSRRGHAGQPGSPRWPTASPTVIPLLR